jgi:multidrug efflux pump
VIVGGMSLGTLLTIFVVPTMYTLVEQTRYFFKFIIFSFQC